MNKRALLERGGAGLAATSVPTYYYMLTTWSDVTHEINFWPTSWAAVPAGLLACGLILILVARVTQNENEDSMSQRENDAAFRFARAEQVVIEDNIVINSPVADMEDVRGVRLSRNYHRTDRENPTAEPSAVE